MEHFGRADIKAKEVVFISSDDESVKTTMVEQIARVSDLDPPRTIDEFKVFHFQYLGHIEQLSSPRQYSRSVYGTLGRKKNRGYKSRSRRHA